jgi:pilus assembly protein Flp/PilA
MPKMRALMICFKIFPGLSPRCQRSRWFRHGFEALQRLSRDDSGATAIEYGLIVALVSVGLIAVLGQVGSRLQETFQSVADALTPN